MTPTNAKITTAGKSVPFANGLQLQIGQTVSITATATGGGALIMHVNSRGRKPTAVWDETGPDYAIAWTVDAPAGEVDLVLQHSKHGQALGDSLVAKVKIVVGAAAPPTGTPVKIDTQPNPAAPADEAVDPSPLKLKRTMKLGMDDASKYALDVSRAAVEPLGLDTIGVWCSTKNFGPYERDADVANGIVYAATLGVEVLWRAAQSGMTAAVAKARAVRWHLAQARDLFALYKQSPKLAGQKLYYQIGNEPESGYFADGVESYVHDYLKPVATTLRKEFDDRIVLVAGGFSWDAAAMEHVADDVAAVCDAFAFHGYPVGVTGGSMASTKSAVTTAHSRGRQLFISEANLGHGKALKKLAVGDTVGRARLMKQWAADVGPYLIALENLGVDRAYYFLGYDAGTTASPAAALAAGRTDGRTTIKRTSFGEALKGVCAP